MPDRIAELLLTDAAREKLGRREIAVEEVQQLLDNRYVFMRAGRARRSSGELPARRLVVTGWEATQAERRLLDS